MAKKQLTVGSATIVAAGEPFQFGSGNWGQLISVRLKSGQMYPKQLRLTAKDGMQDQFLVSEAEVADGIEVTIKASDCGQYLNASKTPQVGGIDDLKLFM